VGVIHLQPGDQVGSVEVYTVPEGKRLIVDYMEASAFASSQDEGVRVEIDGLSNVNPGNHFLPMTESRSSGMFVGGQLVSFSFSPGTVVSFKLVVTSPAVDFPNVQAGFTGYLVNA
jgi:hypothetical protein